MKEVAKTKIAGDRSKYTTARSAKGKKSLNNGDSVAVTLEGFDTETVAKITAEITGLDVLDLEAKYAHLNGGQQRMNMGNRIRGVVKRMNAEKEGSGDKLLDKTAKPHRAALKEAAKARKEAEKSAA